MATLLTICQDAASQLGLRQPSAVVGSNDLTSQIMLRLANQAGKELARYHDWNALTVEHTFTTIAAVVQTSGLPSDYDRMLYNPEIWNRTLALRYAGPTPQRVWQRLQIGVAAGVAGYWRLKGGALNIHPAPTAGQTVAFEYITKNWCESSDGDGQALFMADTDVPLIPEDLFALEIVWRFRASRGFAAYAEDLKTCEIEKEKAASRDRGSGKIRPNNNDLGDPPPPVWDGTIG
jgi:hypothetical protein